MDLDTVAVVILGLLLPGTAFLFTVNHHARIDRSSSSTALAEISAALTIAIIIHFACIFFLYFLASLYEILHSRSLIDLMSSTWDALISGKPWKEIESTYHIMISIYIILSIGAAFVAGLLYLWRIHRGWETIDFVYGPLLPFVVKNGQSDFVVQATVITKHVVGYRTLMYVGYIDKIGISSDRSISSIVLNTPSRFFMVAATPNKLFTQPKPLDDDEESVVDDKIFLSGSEIANVYFQKREFSNLSLSIYKHNLKLKRTRSRRKLLKLRRYPLLFWIARQFLLVRRWAVDRRAWIKQRSHRYLVRIRILRR